MRDRYVALIHPPASGSEWGVTFPDLPGCTSAGKGYEDAIDHAAEALAGHVAALLADGDPVPEARNYDQLQRDEDFMTEVRQGALPSMIYLVDVPAPKERINVMIDRGVLRRVDEAARSEGISRSAYLERAAAAGLVPLNHPIRRMAGGANAAVEVTSGSQGSGPTGAWPMTGKRKISV